MFPRIKIKPLLILLNYLVLVYSRKYDQCELLRILVEEHSLSFEDALGFTCVAQETSDCETTYAHSINDQKVFGIFGISEGKTCIFGSPNGICGVTCDKFLDDNIEDDLNCIKTILKRTNNRPKSFMNCERQMWKNVKEDCEDDLKDLKGSEGEGENFFELADFVSEMQKPTKNINRKTKKPLKNPKPTKKVEVRPSENVLMNGSTFIVKSDQNSDANIRITIDLTKPQPLSDTNVAASLRTQKPFTQNSKPSVQNIQSSIDPGIPKHYYIELFHQLTETTLVLKYELYPPYEEENVGLMMKNDIDAMKIKGWDLRGPFEDTSNNRRSKKKRGSSDEFRLRQIQVKD